MKISIGTNIKEGPWGGGNLFAINLKSYLIDKGHKVVHNLSDKDIDVILITEPRRTSESSAFTHIEVKEYLQYVKFDTLVVHRINECDERKDTNYVNKYLLNANKVADATVFVSTWLQNLYLKQGLISNEVTTILSGSNLKVFNSKGKEKWNKKEKLKIVTHHWGANWKKGFDTYSQLDILLNKDEWKNKIEFHYIGNTPKNFKFKNSITHLPLSGQELAEEIKKNHIYLTASLNEPSGNHHIEGAQCGLPLLYINSGGIPEYCKGYGVMFEEANFEIKLKEIITNYEHYSQKINSYKYNSGLMCSEYLALFEDIINRKKEIYEKREIRLNKSYLKEIFYNYKVSVNRKFNI